MSEPRVDVRDGFSDTEREGIAASARRARTLDRELARRLEWRAPPGRTEAAPLRVEAREGRRLAPAVERELVLAAQRGDRDARGRLLEAYLPLIASIARTYRSSRSLDRLELMQEGAVGLLRALERYEPDRGTPFWAYASWWVRQAMQQLVAELTGPMVLSDRALRELARLKDAYAGHLRLHGREPSSRQLAASAGLDEEQVDNLIAADRSPRALEEPVAGEDGEVGTFGELIADPLAEDEYERVVARIEVEEVRDLLSGLSDRERAILAKRYGLDGPQQSLREVAGGLGLSAERVRQLEQRALGKLRAAAGEGPLDAAPRRPMSGSAGRGVREDLAPDTGQEGGEKR